MHRLGLELGQRVRRLRRVRRLSLRDVAARSGTSASFLSQLERGHCGASVATLMRVAAALGVGVGDFFAAGESPGPAVLRRADRPALPPDHGLRKTLVTSRASTAMEVYTGELAPGGSTGDEPHQHGDADEFLLVVTGEVCVEVGGVTYVLHAGDSIEYRTALPHRAANRADGPAEVLWVVGPPTSTAHD
jgi:transcriptional regulator with XRE-family HTH domain